MIERMGNKFELQCDYCSNYVDDFESFQEAVNYKKENRWKSVNVKGEWTDKCLNCQERSND